MLFITHNIYDSKLLIY